MPSYISNIQVPPTITMSEHVAAHDPHPKYLLAENLVSSINVQVSLEDLNDILIEENAELNNTVLVHNSGSWEPVSVSALLVSAIPYATTENSGTVKLAVDEDIASKNTATVVTPNLLYPYFTRYDSAINELNSRADSAVTRIPVATEVLPGIARLATSNDVNNNTDSTIVTPPLLNKVSSALSASIDLKLDSKQPILEPNGLYTSVIKFIDDTVNPSVTKYKVDVTEPLSNMPRDLEVLTNALSEHNESTDAHADLFAAFLDKGSFVVTDDAAGYVLLPINERYNLVAQWGYISSDRFVTATSNAFSVDYKVREDFTYPLHYVINVTFSPDMLTQSVVLNKDYIFTSNNAGDTVYNRFLNNGAADPYSDEVLLTNNIETFVCTASKDGATAGGTSWLSLGVAVNTDVEPNTLFVAWMPPHIEYSKDLVGYAKRKTYPIGIDEYQIIPIIAVEANRTDRWYGHDYLQTITDVVDGSFACNANTLDAKDTFKDAPDCFNSTWALLGKMKSLKDYTNCEIGINGLGLDSDYYYNFLPITLNLDHCSIEKIDKNTLCIKIKISATQTFVIQSGVVAGGTANKDIHWLNLPTPLNDLLHADFSVRAYTSSDTLANHTERNVYINYAARCNSNGLYPEYQGKICALSITSLGFKNIANSTSDTSVYYNKKHQIQWIVYGIVNEENSDYVPDVIYEPTNKYLSIPVSYNYRLKFNWGSLTHREVKINGTEEEYHNTTPYSSLDEYNGAVMTINGSVADENAPVVGQTQQLYRYFIRFYNKMYWCNNEPIPFDRVIKCGVTQFQWKETYNSVTEQYDDFFVTGDYDGSDFTFDVEFSSDTKDPNRLKHQMKYNTYNGTKQDVGTAQYRQDVEKNNYQYQLFLDRTYWGSYVVATETAPQSGVTYYTKNNKGVYSEFTGTTFASDTTYYVKADKNIPAYSDLCVVHNAEGSGTNGSGCITNLSWMMIIATDRTYTLASRQAITESSLVTWFLQGYGYNDVNYNRIADPNIWTTHGTNVIVETTDTSPREGITYYILSNNQYTIFTGTEFTPGTKYYTIDDNTIHRYQCAVSGNSRYGTVTTNVDNSQTYVNSGSNLHTSNDDGRCDYVTDMYGKIYSMDVDAHAYSVGQNIDEPYASASVNWIIRRFISSEEQHPEGYYSLEKCYIHAMAQHLGDPANQSWAYMIYFEDDTKLQVKNNHIYIENLHFKAADLTDTDVPANTFNYTNDPNPVETGYDNTDLTFHRTNSNFNGQDIGISFSFEIQNNGDILITCHVGVHVIIQRYCYAEIISSYSVDSNGVNIPATFKYHEPEERDVSK